MRKPHPPLRPLAVSIVVSRAHIIIPVAALVVLALALTPGLALLLAPAQPVALRREEPAQEYTATSAPVFASLAMAVSGALPPPDPRQRKAPCDPDLEHEINGYCWTPIAVHPCPVGKAWAHNGRCYQRALRAEKLPRDPTSGEQRPLGIADP